MEKFWQLLSESVIVQATVTLVLVLACVYMTATGREIPQFLEGATLLCLGYYFGSKTQQTLSKRGG